MTMSFNIRAKTPKRRLNSSPFEMRESNLRSRQDHITTVKFAYVNKSLTTIISGGTGSSSKIFDGERFQLWLSTDYLAVGWREGRLWNTFGWETDLIIFGTRTPDSHWPWITVVMSFSLKLTDRECWTTMMTLVALGMFLQFDQLKRLLFSKHAIHTSSYAFNPASQTLALRVCLKCRRLDEERTV